MSNKTKISEKISCLEQELGEAWQELIINEYEERQTQIKIFYEAELQVLENKINEFLRRKDVEVIDILSHFRGDGIMVVYREVRKK